MSGTEHWPNDALDRIQRELAGAETPLYLVADDILRVLEAAEAVPSATAKRDALRQALREIAALGRTDGPAAPLLVKAGDIAEAALPNDDSAAA